MDTEQTPTPESTPESEAQRNPDSGSSTGEVLTMSLFGVMVVVASICLVIW